MNSTRTIDALLRFWWIVVAFTVAGGVFGGLPAPENAADSITRWEASHTILVSSTTDSGSIFTDPLAFNQLQLFATTGQVPERAAETLDYQGAPAELAAQVTVTADQQSGALRISTTQDTPDRAVAVADTFGQELLGYLSERQDEVRQNRLASSLARLQTLEIDVEEAGTEALSAPDDPVAQATLDALSRQYSVVFEQYTVLQADQGQLVLTTLENAQPVAVTEGGLSAPRSRAGRGVLGALVGGLLGGGIAVLLARADRRIRTREQAEEVLGMTAHAMIPKVDGHRTAELAVGPDRHDPVADSYRTLRSILTFVDAGHERDHGTAPITVVVSPGPGDGKTSLASNLVSAFVEAGDRAVAVNTDFRRPTLSNRLRVPFPEPIGMTLSEIEDAPLDLLLVSGSQRGLSVFDLAGLKHQSPGDLARTTARVVPRIAAVTDHVVIDTSPVGATAEVLEFVPLADTIIVVVTLGHTSIQATRRSIEMLNTLSRGHILLVLIGGDVSESNYYYYTSKAASAPSGHWLGRRRNQSEGVHWSTTASVTSTLESATALEKDLISNGEHPLESSDAGQSETDPSRTSTPAGGSASEQQPSSQP